MIVGLLGSTNDFDSWAIRLFLGERVPQTMHVKSSRKVSSLRCCGDRSANEVEGDGPLPFRSRSLPEAAARFENDQSKSEMTRGGYSYEVDAVAVAAAVVADGSITPPDRPEDVRCACCSCRV